MKSGEDKSNSKALMKSKSKENKSKFQKQAKKRIYSSQNSSPINKSIVNKFNGYNPLRRYSIVNDSKRTSKNSWEKNSIDIQKNDENSLYSIYQHKNKDNETIISTGSKINQIKSIAPKLFRRNKSSYGSYDSKSKFSESEYKNFKDAYMALYNKISNNQGSSIILPHKNPYTTNGTSISKRNPALFNKLHNEKLGKIHLKVKEDSILHILEEEKELTFHPKVRNPFNLKRRSVEEFLQDMVIMKMIWFRITMVDSKKKTG